MTDLDRLRIALDKWEQAKRGERPIISDNELDQLGDHFMDNGSAAGDEYFRHSATIHNQNRVGILDAYILLGPDDKIEQNDKV